MKTLLTAILAISLSACASIFGPDDWEPTGHMQVGGMVSANGGTMGPVNLYRENPNEKPRVVRVQVADGKARDITVYANRCFGENGTAYAIGGAIYLCGRKGVEKHELAHSAGMKHTAWVSNGVGICATVLSSGYKTGYVVGKEICIANDYEMVSK